VGGGLFAVSVWGMICDLSVGFVLALDGVAWWGGVCAAYAAGFVCGVARLRLGRWGRVACGREVVGRDGEDCAVEGFVSGFSALGVSGWDGVVVALGGIGGVLRGGVVLGDGIFGGLGLVVLWFVW